MLKINTLDEVRELGINDDELKKRCVEIINVLDELYGEERDVDTDDGGFIIILEPNETTFNLDVFKYFEYKNIDNILDHSEIPPTKVGNYVEVLILTSNDFGITIFIPRENVDESIELEEY